MFGFDARQVLVGLADALQEKAWKPLKRKAKYEIHTEPRRRPRNIEEAVVIEREFNNIRLVSEDVAEIAFIVRAGRRIIFRLLSWNPWQPVFLRAVDQLHGKMNC